jgi:hypothetical protein
VKQPDLDEMGRMRIGPGLRSVLPTGNRNGGHTVGVGGNRVTVEVVVLAIEAEVVVETEELDIKVVVDIEFVLDAVVAVIVVERDVDAVLVDDFLVLVIVDVFIFVIVLIVRDTVSENVVNTIVVLNGKLEAVKVKVVMTDMALNLDVGKPQYG